MIEDNLSPANSSRMIGEEASSRALFYAPQGAFDRPVPPVRASIFSQEAALALAEDAPTGPILCDRSEALGSNWPATTPTMLARYLTLRENETFGHELISSGEVYYVIRGQGTTQCLDEAFDWKSGDAFCLPGGETVTHRAISRSVLLQVTNEPELAYLCAKPADRAMAPTLFRSEITDSHLQSVHDRTGEQLAAGKSVIFLTEMMAERRVTTPTLLSSINTLEAGGDQRAHRHSSAALTLCIESDGIYSKVGDERIDWEPFALIVTPPNLVHSHHNRGPRMMRSYVVQDTGLHSELRTTNFAWSE